VCVRVCVCVCLTLSPRGFRTLGFLEKWTWVLPSSPSVTASFFSVALPQWGQKALVMMLVVLQGEPQTELVVLGVQVLASGGLDSPEAGVASQDVVPGLPDQHPVDGQHVEPDLDEDVLERGPADQTLSGPVLIRPSADRS